MADSRIRLPSSEGGIVRYGDEEDDAIFILKPEYVLIACAAVAIIVVAVQALKLL